MKVCTGTICECNCFYYLVCDQEGKRSESKGKGRCCQGVGQKLIPLYLFECFPGQTS